MSAYFSRPRLADQMVAATSGVDEFSDASSGLFIAAPRRTGKTTFLRGDLIPAFERAGVLAVYVDLWANQAADPFDLVTAAVARALAESRGLLGKAKGMTTAAISALTINGVNVNLNAIGQSGSATLTDVIRDLWRSTAKPVALIIDEAQHSLTSARGDALMFGLKSARDQLNLPGEANLRLVMSGSDRDKFLRLVNTPASPFYGAAVKDMPKLGKPYIEHIAARIETAYPHLAPLERAKMVEAFDLFAQRPEHFTMAYREALDPTSEIAGIVRMEDRLLEAARRHLDREAAEYDALFLGLSDVERAMVARMLQMRDTFRPMDAEALSFYRGFLDKEVNTNQVNSALQRLRDNSPPLVWKSTRGDYALADSGMDRWYAEKVAAKQWPPTL